MNRKSGLYYLPFAILCFGIGELISQVPSEDNNKSTDIHLQSHSHNNHVAFFAGWTTQPKRNNSAFTIGADYSRKISHSHWSVGVVGEMIFAHHTEGLALAPVYNHIKDEMWLRSGPGIEFYKNDGDERRLTEFVFRFGAGYDIGLGNWILTPSLDLDLYRSARALVLGINIGKGF